MLRLDPRPVSAISHINLYGFDIPLKLEREPGSGGSHKEWAAAGVVKSLRVRGLGISRWRLILSSSGNTAQAIAAQTANLKIELHVVADVLSPPLQLAKLGKFDHVRLHVVDSPDASGSHMQARRQKIAQLGDRFGDDALELDQYSSEAFPQAYKTTLAAEINSQMPDLAAIYDPVGTCGTALGFEDYRTAYARRWTVIPVDVPGSRLFEVGACHAGKRIFSGIGNGIRTHFAEQLRMEPRYVEALEVARICRFVAERRDLWLGPSSGAAIAAVVQDAFQNRLPHWGAVLAICPDSGDAYRETLYDDDWLIANGLGKALLGV